MTFPRTFPSVHAGKELSRGQLAGLVGVGLLLLYGGYSQLVTPMAQPPGIETSASRRTAVERLPAPLTNLQIAREHLPHAAWAGDAKYQLRTDSSFVYAEQWKQIDSDNAIRFKPFAMVWMQKGRKPGEAPITIVSESAYIRFANKFDLTKPNPGRVIGGTLEGRVEIRGPNGLRVVGKTFLFSEKSMRLWSDEAIRFWYGPHKGQAEGLRCDLLGPDGPQPPNRLAVTGIQNIRLRRNVAMNFVFQEGDRKNIFGHSSRQQTARPTTAAPPRQKKKPVRVRIRCKGGFEFGVQTNVATFEDDVRVYRPTKPEQYDVLLCDLLTLIFEPASESADSENAEKNTNGPSRQFPADSPAGSSPPSLTTTRRWKPPLEGGMATPPGMADSPQAKTGGKDGEQERFRGIQGRLSFQRLRAQPRYPRRHVVLISESNRLTAHMDDFIYDAQSKVAVLRDREAVQVVQDTSETQAPKITLLRDGKGSLSSLLCEGAGWIRHYEKESGQVDLVARWSKWLRKFPDPLSALDIIELQDDAVLQQPEKNSTLQADFIRIWIDRRKRKNDAEVERPPVPQRSTYSTGYSPAGPSPPRRASPQRDEKRRRTKIRRLLAIDSVELTSPDLLAQTKRMEVWFEYPSEVQPASSSPAGSSHVPLRIRPRRDLSGGQLPQRQSPQRRLPPERLSRDRLSRNRLVPAHLREGRSGWASVPDKTVASTGNSKEQTDFFGRRKGDGPLEVTADLIRVRIAQGRDRKTSQVREIRTRGNVRVRQNHGPSEQPLHITGDRMHLVARSREDHLLHVYGRPAHIRDRGMHIEGENVHLDRGENRSWVDGKGLLQLPVKRTLEGRQLAQPQILDIWWKKQMDFDGLTARFRGQVRAVVEDSRVRCEELDVLMARRISFGRRPAGSRQQPQIQTVFCRGGVDVESYEYRESRLVQIRKARMEEFTVQQQSGDTHAQGPGWIIVWRRGNNDRRTKWAAGQVRANRSARQTTDSRKKWNYTRIDFAGDSTGNLKQRFNRFRKHVQIVYGPVERPPHIIDVDADTFPEGAGWLRSRELVVTQHPTTKTEAAYVTLRAEGNAEVDGRGFHARADTITYDESRDLYVFRSIGRQKVSIWRQTKPGGERNRADAQRMQFIPSRNILTLDRTTTLDGLR